MSLLLTLVVCLCGCHKMVEDDGELTLYASFYPIYVLALGICQDVPDTHLRCLTLPQDSCIRSYELSQWDAGILTDADALILGGRGLESFQEQAEASGFPMVLAMEGVALTGDDTEADDAENHWAGPNPWLFLDPAGAAEIESSIAHALALLDPGNAARYEENLEKETRKLNDLAADMAVPEGGSVAVLHEGLIYLARAMNLSVTAQVEREPGYALSDNELALAFKTLGESGARTVLLERQAPDSLERELAQAGYSVARVDTLTTHTQADPDAYFGIMRENALEVRRALDAAQD